MLKSQRISEGQFSMRQKAYDQQVTLSCITRLVEDSDKFCLTRTIPGGTAEEGDSGRANHSCALKSTTLFWVTLRIQLEKIKLL